MTNRLQNKICLVTGAGRGIGAAIARAFTVEGGRIIVTDKDSASVTALAQEIGATAAILDVTLEEHWSRIKQA